MSRLPGWAIALVSGLAKDEVSRDGPLGDLEERFIRRRVGGGAERGSGSPERS